MSGKFKPESFLALGKECTYRDVRYQIIGRICKEAQISEWDAEDQRYYDEPWSSDLWVLVGAQKEYLYITEDREGYAISTAFTPSAPSIPPEDARTMTLETATPPRRILERGTAKTVYFEGEFTWTPAIGDIDKYCEYDAGGVRYSVEWKVSPDGAGIEEVEFFATRPIGKLELAELFGEQSILDEARRASQHKAQYRQWSVLFWVAGMISTLFAVTALFREGTLVDRFEIEMAKIADTGLIRGPFQLDQVGRVHELVLSTSIPDNSEAWGAAELLNGEQAAINALEGEFWRESGYDSDGHWSESDTTHSRLFRLDHPGTYYVRLMADGASAPAATLRFELYKDVPLARWYILTTLLCFGLAVAMVKYQSTNPLYIVAGLFAVGYFVLSMLADDD
ncbi:MAG: DUF4178 domain-containing protein [Bdellovibrionales bacterium]|nr:DUF4178 domain-containing protein [Bdellovibrionales bacterium]